MIDRGQPEPNGGDAGAPLRVLTFTSLFPSAARPRHGIFVETRLRQLMKDRPVDPRVIAPVPWFPFSAATFGTYAAFAATPRREMRPDGLAVTHPRYLMLPRVGVAVQPDSMARAAWRDVLALQRSGWRPQLIDAHYLYPDGVAASLLAERLGVPFIVTARGTDVNVLARGPGTGPRILRMLQRAARVVTVSGRLKESLVSLGVDEARLEVLRNGVDTTLFQPEDARAARQALGLPDGRLALCVGNLVPEKGLALALEVMSSLPQWQLAIVGEGPLRADLEVLAGRLGIAQRVRFLPVMPQRVLRSLYSAADTMLLTSTREGWPNVVLEAMACGTPVVAVDVGAVADMITDKAVGRVVPGRKASDLAAAVLELCAVPVAREAIRRHACSFGWEPISAGQFELMRRAIDGAGAPAAEPAPAAALARTAGR